MLMPVIMPYQGDFTWLHFLTKGHMVGKLCVLRKDLALICGNRPSHATWTEQAGIQLRGSLTRYLLLSVQ